MTKDAKWDSMACEGVKYRASDGVHGVQLVRRERQL